MVWLITGNAVGVAQVNVHGGVDMSLKTPWHVVKAAVELDDGSPHFPNPRHKRDSFGNFVPCCIIFVCLGILRGRNGLVVEDKRVEVDDLGMRMKNVDGQLSRDEARDRRDDSEGFLLAQHGGQRGCRR